MKNINSKKNGCVRSSRFSRIVGRTNVKPPLGIPSICILKSTNKIKSWQSSGRPTYKTSEFATLSRQKCYLQDVQKMSQLNSIEVTDILSGTYQLGNSATCTAIGERTTF